MVCQHKTQGQVSSDGRIASKKFVRTSFHHTWTFMFTHKIFEFYWKNVRVACIAFRIIKAHEDRFHRKEIQIECSTSTCIEVEGQVTHTVKLTSFYLAYLNYIQNRLLEFRPNLSFFIQPTKDIKIAIHCCSTWPRNFCSWTKLKWWFFLKILLEIHHKRYICCNGCCENNKWWTWIDGQCWIGIPL